MQITYWRHQKMERLFPGKKNQIASHMQTRVYEHVEHFCVNSQQSITLYFNYSFRPKQCSQCKLNVLHCMFEKGIDSTERDRIIHQ